MDAETELALLHAGSAHRAVLETIWALDAQFGQIVRTTSEPMIGAMRLTWWREALEKLEKGDAPAEPLLQRVRATLVNESIGLGRLPDMAEGWIALLDPFPLSEDALTEFARLRGGILFSECARVTGGAADLVAQAGRGWALVDFALRCSDRDTAERALAQALRELDGALAIRWPRHARWLGMIAVLARDDARRGRAAERRQGSPGRAFRMLRFRLTGR